MIRKVLIALALLGMLSSSYAGEIRCPRTGYPYAQLQVYACSKRENKQPVIILDRENYKFLKGEYEQCNGRLGPREAIYICGIRVEQKKVK